MYCEACGKKIPEDSKFCEFCGHPVKTEVKPTVEPKLPVEEPAVAKPNVTQPIKKPKTKSKSKLMPIILIALLVAGGYFAMSFLGMDDLLAKITDLPGLIFGNDSKEPTREDFSWYVPMSYDVVPQDGVELSYKDILGKWKVMVVNYVSEPEETYFSTVVLKETSSSDNNTSADFTHHYVEYDGQKYPFEGVEAKDLLYGNYADSYLRLVLGDDNIAEIIFWSKDGKEYGQSHIFSDWDNDGIADLATVVLFMR